MPAPISRTLNTAQHDSQIMLFGCFTECIQVTGFDLNSIGHIMGMKFFLHRGVEFSAIGALDPKWITGQQPLAKCDQIASRLSGSIRVFQDFS